MEDQPMLDNLRRRLAEDLSISFRGKKLRVSAAGSLEGVQEDVLPDALAALTAPATLVLKPLQASGCADDHIAAVNLTRPTGSPPDPEALTEALDEVRSAWPPPSMNPPHSWLALSLSVYLFVGGRVGLSACLAACECLHMLRSIHLITPTAMNAVHMPGSDSSATHIRKRDRVLLVCRTQWLALMMLA